MKNFFKLLYVSILCSLFVLSFSVIGKASENTLIIENMKTDNLLEPLGIDSEYPVFSWNLSDPETRGQKQTSYRIMIALSEDDAVSLTSFNNSGLHALYRVIIKSGLLASSSKKILVSNFTSGSCAKYQFGLRP